MGMARVMPQAVLDPPSQRKELGHIQPSESKRRGHMTPYQQATQQMLSQTLFRALLIIMSVAACAMALSPRSAIHEEELDRYDAFLQNLQDTHFLDMYLENGRVKIDVYEHPSNDLALSDSFTPSDTANQYFDQENQRAGEALQPAPPSNDTLYDSPLEKRLTICPRSDSLLNRDASVFEKRVSRCYQFCGTIANCRGNNGCPHCYAVRQGCLWQKWCR